MRISLIEPYFTGSHAAWAREYADHSRHRVELLTLPGRNWKWRMHGGAVTLAGQFLAGQPPDLILATDMLDLTTFLALTRETSSRCPCAIYFHENQLTYPWSPDDRDPAMERDLHYAFINYTSALAADAVVFNSAYHRDAFLAALPAFLDKFPGPAEHASVKRIVDKSHVLPLGLDLHKLDRHRPSASVPDGPPLIVWNHRWEYDKGPLAFFEALYQLADEGVAFRLAVLGESFRNSPEVFAKARERLADRIVQWGYVKSFAEYAQWLWRGDILPVTSRQEFFGASVIQAAYCGCVPLLPERLAYPEHVPPAAGRVLYADDGELVARLRTLLNGADGDKVLLDAYVSRYDWQNLAPVYDAFFERMMKEGRG